MSIVENPAPPESLEKLLTSLERIEKLRDDVLAELLERYGWTPPTVVNQCPHPGRPVFGTLDKQGRPGCFECVRKSHGIKPQELRTARLSDTELAWANRDLDGELAREWRE